MQFLKQLRHNGISPKTFLSFLGFLVLSVGVLFGTLLLNNSLENRSRANIYTDYECSTPDGSITVTLTATHSETTGTKSVTATGGISAPAGFYYDVLANLYRYQCTCPDVNNYECGECSSSYVQITNSGGTSATTTWDGTNSEFPGNTGCATLQSDVTLGGVQLRDPINGNTFSLSCLPAPAEGVSISEVVGYFCGVTPTPTSVVPTRPPTPTATPTPMSYSCARCDADQDGYVEHTPPTADDLNFVIGCLGQSSGSAPCNRADYYPGGPLINSSDVTAFVTNCTSVYPNNQACSAPTATPTPEVNTAWWQSYSGISSAQTTLRSLLPADSYLVANWPPARLNSAGMPFTNTGTIFLGAGGPSEHTSLSSAQGQSASFCQDYSIPGLIEMANASSIVPDTTPIISSYGQLADPAHSKNFGSYRVYRHSGPLEINPLSTWSVSGETLIVFNEGSTVIADGANTGKIIDVSDNAFFGLFSTGNIVFDSSVGFNTPRSGASLSPTVTGLFFSNDPSGSGGRIIIQSTGDATTEKQFVGSGNFIGCTQVKLGRDLGSIDNATYPSEAFIYNASLVNNFPAALKDTHITWDEGI